MIVKFEDKEYNWEEVEGKGRCLVPAPGRRLYAVGDRFYAWENRARRQVVDVSGTYTVVGDSGRSAVVPLDSLDALQRVLDGLGEDYFQGWADE